MKPGETKNKSAVRIHTAGAAMYLAVTVTARVLSLISAPLADESAAVSPALPEGATDADALFRFPPL